MVLKKDKELLTYEKTFEELGGERKTREENFKKELIDLQEENTKEYADFYDQINFLENPIKRKTAFTGEVGLFYQKKETMKELQARIRQLEDENHELKLKNRKLNDQLSYSNSQIASMLKEYSADVPKIENLR